MVQLGENFEDRKREYEIHRNREFRNVYIETMFWALVAFLIGWLWYYNAYLYEKSIDQYQLFNIIIVSSIVFVIPVLTRLIFGFFPLQLIRNRIKNKKEGPFADDMHISGRFVSNEEEQGIDQIGDRLREEALLNLDSEEYLVELCLSSEKLARTLMRRSSSYLFIGSLIALVGIVYFSFQTVDIVNSNLPGFDVFIHFLPRIGALFFIEFIAFFFLKQYRITMDDFKHYESIQRQRQSNLTILKFYTDTKYTDKTDLLEAVMKHMDLFNNPSVLKGGETTESVQNRQFSNQELDIMNNIVNQMGQLKK